MIASQSPEAGDVYLLSLTEHLHVKKAQFLCGQDLSGPIFYLIEQSAGFYRLQVEDKTTSSDLPIHLFTAQFPLSPNPSGRPGRDFRDTVSLCSVVVVGAEEQEGVRLRQPFGHRQPWARWWQCTAPARRAAQGSPIRGSPPPLYPERQFSA